jgi:16S rRNA (cytosine967-C5)-methyltransferase
VDLDFPLPLVDAGSFPSQFDAVLVDAPCSGSGTWRRTPEIVGQWPEGGPEELTARQSRILDHVWPYVKSGGKLIYLTCSVYNIENEQQVGAFEERSGARLITQRYFNRLSDGGDVLFGAVLEKV